jgi:GWxTD domain-containing protein
LFQSNLHKYVSACLLILGQLVAAEGFDEVNLGVSIDESRFSIQGGIYLDIYLMVPQANFTYEDGENGAEAQVVFQTALIQGDIVPYTPDRWNRVYKAKDKDAISALRFVPDISKFYVLPGEYVLQVDILDVNGKRRQRIEKELVLSAFPSDSLSISDITIASQIIKAKAENEFTKYGYDVVPNAERSFSQQSPMLYYYFECYGLQGTGSYEVAVSVLSLNEDVIQSYPMREKPKPGASAVEWGGVNTAGLRSGIYKLAIDVHDPVSDMKQRQTKTFYVLKTNDLAGMPQLATNPYLDLTEEELDEIYATMKIIMDTREKELYEQSGVEGKANVLHAFWLRNDPDPETAYNEFKTDFYNRVQMANDLYRAEKLDGWKTDRGRVLLQYGVPNNVERTESSQERKPFEIWSYYGIQGGVEFIFVDRTGYGSYKLVHSTARDEGRDYNWERNLY